MKGTELGISSKFAANRLSSIGIRERPVNLFRPLYGQSRPVIRFADSGDYRAPMNRERMLGNTEVRQITYA
jgi:hypothetical protein